MGLFSNKNDEPKPVGGHWLTGEPIGPWQEGNGLSDEEMKRHGGVDVCDHGVDTRRHCYEC